MGLISTHELANDDRLTNSRDLRRYRGAAGSMNAKVVPTDYPDRELAAGADVPGSNSISLGKAKAEVFSVIAQQSPRRPTRRLSPSDPRIDEIEALMTAYEQQDVFSRAVLVAEGRRIVYERAVAYANREWSIPNALDTRFRIASLSKRFTKVLVLQLVEEGELSLDGTIADYLSDYTGPAADGITIELLLNHRSGIVGE